MRHRSRVLASARVPRAGLRYVFQRLGLLLVFGVLLFVSAGRWDWAQGWAYLGVVLVAEGGSLALLAARAPETLARRGRGGAGVPGWDRAFAALWLLLALATPVVAGLDAGRAGAAPLAPALLYPGALVVLLASALATWAMLVNEHFEQFVRIQSDRGHRVVTSGPYRWVRHPGYLAAIAGALATPPMLGSAWAFAPAGLIAALFVARTHLEDRMLGRELPGYRAYATRTRYRLLPGVW